MEFIWVYNDFMPNSTEQYFTLLTRRKCVKMNFLLYAKLNAAFSKQFICHNLWTLNCCLQFNILASENCNFWRNPVY